jgi:hypothetical protein
MKNGFVYLNPFYSSQQLLWTDQDEVEKNKKVGWKFWKPAKGESRTILELFLFSIDKEKKSKRSAFQCVNCDLYCLKGSV